MSHMRMQINPVVFLGPFSRIRARFAVIVLLESSIRKQRAKNVLDLKCKMQGPLGSPYVCWMGHLLGLALCAAVGRPTRAVLHRLVPLRALSACRGLAESTTRERSRALAATESNWCSSFMIVHLALMSSHRRAAASVEKNKYGCCRINKLTKLAYKPSSSSSNLLLLLNPATRDGVRKSCSIYGENNFVIATLQAACLRRASFLERV